MSATQTAPVTMEAMAAMLQQMQAALAKTQAENAALKAAGPKPKVPLQVRTEAEVIAASKVICGTEAAARTFSTGSRGYYGSGKVEINGKKYQCSVSLVECGSKPEAK